MSCVCRFIEKKDLARVMEIERAFSTISLNDEDFDGVEFLVPWRKSTDDILQLIRQRRDKENNSFDTRTYVLEDRTGQVVGVLVYEFQDEGYEIVFLAVDPNCPQFDEVVLEALTHVKDKAERSTKRHLVQITLRDRDEARFPQLARLLFRSGFPAPKLIVDHFEDHVDGWGYTLRIPSESSSST